MKTRKRTRALAVFVAVLIVASFFLIFLEPSSAVTITGTTVKGNRLQFIYTVSTSGNTTSISWALWCDRTVTSTNTYKKSAPTVVKINGSTVADKNTYYDVRDDSKKLLSGTTNVARSNGAAKKVAIYGSVNLSGTSVAGTISVSGTIALPAYTAGKQDVTVTIDWIDNNNADGKRPEVVTVTLYRNGTAYKNAEVSTQENKLTFTDLPKAYGGTVYSYTAGGSSEEDYTVSDPNSRTVTYTYDIVPELGFRIGFTI